ncbi:MAG: aminoacyl-tRNA hydrolase [Lachnospiraceae bacterium]|nr:aminoacyl-tRNA hydrolase [Lachnospiraceae bacterium]
MYLIAGLGNPTKQYEHTRHNIGFEVIDALAEKYNITMKEKKHKALIGKGVIEGQKVILAKPQTYMNLSGESIVKLVHYYKLNPEEKLIVIYDDISFVPGNLRIRQSGSAGGHNGVKSIIKCLDTQKFIRIKVGVGEKPKDWDLADFVLGHFNKQEREDLEGAIERAVEATGCLVNGNVAKAMNEYNKKVIK